MNEIITNLLVEINTVSHHNKARPFYDTVLFHTFLQYYFCKHNHRNSFSAALGMPHNAASGVFTVLKQNAIHTFLDRKILLVAAYFFDIIIVNNEIANYIKKSLRMQQRDKSTVLLLDTAVGRAFPAPLIQPVLIIFVPRNKVFCRRSAGAVQNLIGIDRHYNL